MPMTKGAQKFTDLMELLKSDAESRVRVMVEGSFDVDTPDVFGIEQLTDDGINQAFSREELNNLFKERTKGKFSAAQKLGIAYQTDVIAGMHKASILRFRTRVRAMATGILRDAGQISDHGYIAFVMQQLPLMEQGQSGDQSE